MYKRRKKKSTAKPIAVTQEKKKISDVLDTLKKNLKNF